MCIECFFSCIKVEINCLKPWIRIKAWMMIISHIICTKIIWSIWSTDQIAWLSTRFWSLTSNKKTHAFLSPQIRPTVDYFLIFENVEIPFRLFHKQRSQLINFVIFEKRWKMFFFSIFLIAFMIDYFCCFWKR